MITPSSAALYQLGSVIAAAQKDAFFLTVTPLVSGGFIVIYYCSVPFRTLKNKILFFPPSPKNPSFAVSSTKMVLNSIWQNRKGQMFTRLRDDFLRRHA